MLTYLFSNSWFIHYELMGLQNIGVNQTRLILLFLFPTLGFNMLLVLKALPNWSKSPKKLIFFGLRNTKLQLFSL